MRTHRHPLGRLLAPRGGEVSRGLLAVGLGAVGQLASVGLLATAAWLITTASERPPVLTLTVAIAGVRLFALLRGTSRYGERLASHDLALRVLARIRVWAFAHLEPLVPGAWPGNRRGDLLARFVSDVDGLQDLYVRVGIPFAAALATLGITVAAAALLDPEAGLVLAAGLAVAVFAVPLTTGVIGAYGGAAQSDRRGARDSIMVELLHGSSEIAVFGAGHEAVAHILKAERDLAVHNRRASVSRALGAGMGVALGGVLTAAVVAASIPALDAGRISGVVVAVLGFLALGSAEAVSNLPASFARVVGALGGANRLLSLASASESAGRQEEDHGEVVAPGRAPTIELDDVTVTYDRRRRPALEHVDLTIGAGQHVAVVGASGAGKTTLGHLLLGFTRPTEGRVVFDRVDLSHIDPEAARRMIAWAPQDPHVFHTTLAGNLRLARPRATDGELENVLGQVGLGEWLDRLSNRLDTVLGERGATVSGGERQRLGVARALLADRPVVILDEPTAHLDGESETLLRSSVLAATPGKTLIWITHRVGDLHMFDRVVTLHHGHATAGDPGLPALDRGDRSLRSAQQSLRQSLRQPLGLS